MVNLYFLEGLLLPSPSFSFPSSRWAIGRSQPPEGLRQNGKFFHSLPKKKLLFRLKTWGPPDTWSSFSHWLPTLRQTSKISKVLNIWGYSSWEIPCYPLESWWPLGLIRPEKAAFVVDLTGAQLCLSDLSQLSWAETVLAFHGGVAPFQSQLNWQIEKWEKTPAVIYVNESVGGYGGASLSHQLFTKMDPIFFL